MKRSIKWIVGLVLILGGMAQATAGEPAVANYAKEIPGFWRELGTSTTIDGEVEPSKDYWYFKPNGTLATQGTAMFGGDRPYSVEGDKVRSDSVGGTYTIVSLQGDRMVLRGPVGGFWHLERRHFDPSLERSGRYYSREQVAMVMEETVCTGMNNLGADSALIEQKLMERLKLRGMASVDKDKFTASTKYYSDDPEFVTGQSTALAQTMRSCKKRN